MTDREIKQTQEDRLYETLLVQKLADDGNLTALRMYLRVAGVKAKNGMGETEVDAVKERVNQAYSELSKITPN